MKFWQTAATITVLSALIYFSFAFIVNAAPTVCSIQNGCTGTSTAPSFGQILIGGPNGQYLFVASSTLGGTSGVNSVFGRTGAVTAQSGDYTTSLVPEGSNLYWTQARFDGALTGTTSLPQITTLASLSLPYSQLTGAPDLSAYLTLANWYATTTDALDEGLNNLYFTNARADARFVAGLSATTSVKSITTLPSLSLPYSQLTDIPADVAFSTTSADYWKGVNNFFSTSSTAYWLSQNQGAAFSTTSADAWGASKGYITWPWTPATNYGIAVQSTTTPLWMNGAGVFASSTNARPAVAANSSSSGRALEIVSTGTGPGIWQQQLGTNAFLWTAIAKSENTNPIDIAHNPDSPTLSTTKSFSLANNTNARGTLMLLTNAGTNKSLLVDHNDTTDWATVIDSTGFGLRVIGGGSATPLQVEDGTNNVSLLVNSSGNVGIASSTPGSTMRFTVGGNSFFGGTVNATGTITAPSSIITNATSTNHDITGLLTFNGVTGNEWADFCTTITGGSDLCDGNDASGGGGVWPFTPSSYAGVANQSTTTPFWLNGTQLIASSTIVVNATSTFMDVRGTLKLGDNFVATTTTVCAYGCDYTSIETAVDTVAASTTILIKNGTYALGAGTITTTAGKSLEVVGESMDGVIITYTGTGAAFTIGASTADTRRFRLENITIIGSSSGVRGLSLVRVKNSYFANIRVVNFSSAGNPGQGFRLEGTGSYTGDNYFYNLQSENNEFGLNLSGTAVNSNHFYGYNLRTTGAAGSIAISIANANGNSFHGGLVGGSNQGFDFNGTADENSVFGTYCENNTTCVVFDSGSADNSVNVIDVETNTTIVTDSGTENNFSVTGNNGRTAFNSGPFLIGKSASTTLNSIFEVAGGALFDNATTTGTHYVTGAFASTTRFFANGLVTCNTGNMLTWSGGVFGCEDDSTGAGGGAWPFTPATYSGQAAQSTSTALWLTGSQLSLVASTTFATNATATQQTITGNAWLTNLTNSLLSTDQNGKLVSTSTIGLASFYAANATIPYASTTALSAATLCLTGDSCRTTWPSGGSGVWPFSPSSYAGIANQSTTTPLWLNGTQLIASSTLAVNATTTGSHYFPSGVWNASGNVGIGTTTPGAPIDLGSATAASKILLFNNVISQYGFGVNASELSIFAGNSANVAFRDGGPAGTTNMLISAAGNVGIATTTPQWPLAIYKTTGGQLSLINGGIGHIFSSYPNGSLVLATSSPSTFATSTNPFLAINSNGWAGFGTSSPSKQLSVVGDSIFQGGIAGTSTVYISSSAAGKGGRVILEDSDGAGCTEVYALNGVLTAATVTCP